jgi:hypothetical protein
MEGTELATLLEFDLTAQLANAADRVGIDMFARALRALGRLGFEVKPQAAGIRSSGSTP